MDYMEWTWELEPAKPWSEVMIAQLGDLGFDSFVETKNGLQAYIPLKNDLELDEVKTQLIAFLQSQEVKADLQEKIIPHQNWNASWEEGFDPVNVDNQVYIRAPFHAVSKDIPINLEIQPQMSFGTGHHQTTYMMCKALMEMEVDGKSVLDMGCGTGVLAILAEKLKAKECLGIEIDPHAVENAVENASRNNTLKSTFVEGDSVPADVKFDIVLANINKNILLSQLADYYRVANSNGILALSGFFESDVEELLKCSKELGWTEKKIYSKESWACIVLVKK